MIRASLPLTVAALASVAVAVGCAIALVVEAAPLLGVHPAVKPLKFAASIAIFLGSLALIVPRLALGPGARGIATWILIATMAIELVAIVTQAVRGQPSHFNVGTRLDGVIWRTMGGAIVVATLAVIGLAAVATLRPIATDRLLATAIRIGLWLTLLVAVSGMAMGGRGGHSIGGVDGGAGLPITNWSRRHGDLRVSHFFALHGLQALPLVALALRWLPTSAAVRWTVLLVVAAGWIAICLATLAQAFAGRPLRA